MTPRDSERIDCWVLVVHPLRVRRSSVGLHLRCRFACADETSRAPSIRPTYRKST
ncbi:hypothetical protein ACTMU2_29120 [Cupriavidus basilensis]